MKDKITNKVQGHSSEKSYEADKTGEMKNPRLLDRGAGSAFSFARAREEAARLRLEKEVPGALGSKIDLNSKANGRLNIKLNRKK